MRGFRHNIQKVRAADAALANAWLTGPKHGGYSPNVRSHRGWVSRDCLGYARERYEVGVSARPCNGDPIPQA